MNKQISSAFLGVLLLLSSQAVLQATVSLDDRTLVASRLLEEIGKAAQSYRSRQQVLSAGTAARKHLTELQEHLMSLRQEERQLRLSISSMQEQWAALEESGVHERHVKKADAIRRFEQSTVLEIAREDYLASLEPLGLRIVSHPNDALRDALKRDAMKMTDTIQAGRVILPTLLASMDRLETMHDEIAAAETEITDTELAVKQADEAINSIKAITRDVHEQVLKLQSAQARIDAQLRSRAERTLIEKGLLSARDGAQHAAAPDLQWPADGPISAGFHNAAYFSHFGVAHQGIDIVVPQSTPVRSAAEGIVFLVRDGGDLGYTYVLIGHRGNIATLYGHLSETSVAGGQRVEAGQEIGRSGGTPGTKGAGPMTTAAHLHFEVIEDGSNVDPVSVLPQH